MDRLLRHIILVALVFAIQGCFLVKIPVKTVKLATEVATAPVKVLSGKKKGQEKNNKSKTVDTDKKTSKSDLK